MEMHINKSGTQCEVNLSGHFTFSDNMKFKEVLALAESAEIKNIVLDFARVEFVDSAALGMLMILRNAAEKRHQTVAIRAAQGQVAKIMRMSRFDTKFNMC